MAARQDGSENGGKTSVTEAEVAAWTWIGRGGRAVVVQHRVVSNNYDRSAAVTTAEARDWLPPLPPPNRQTDRRTDG